MLSCARSSGAVCDRSSWTGGSDGIYLYDAGGAERAGVVLQPGRVVGRVLRQRDAGPRPARSSTCAAPTPRSSPAAAATTRCTARASTPEGVRQVLLELPPLRFDDAALPAPFGGFTAVRGAEPARDRRRRARTREPDLIELGKRADEVFAEGANVSFLQPLADGDAPEVFVRTFERGAGLTPSCGSGRGRVPRRLLPGDRPRPGAARSWSATPAEWPPPRSRSATAPGTRSSRATPRSSTGPRSTAPATRPDPLEYAADENAAYAALDERNTACLKEHGIQTAHP